MAARIHFTGPARYRLRSAAELGLAILEVSARRTLKGPRRPGWNWRLEVVTEQLRKRMRSALTFSSVVEARRYLDSVEIISPALSEVSITPVAQELFRGTWFVGKNAPADVTLLYFHGGGYSFYPRGYANLVALITLAARARTFVLDYPLTPEHRFPAQLETALKSYRWLRESGVALDKLVVAGDSAGGNLALALLLEARDAKLPLPALAVLLSPPTDFEWEIAGDGGCDDWIEKTALRQWAGWFCDPAQRRDPRVSPVRADLRGLPPIYIQAGRDEILFDSIRVFADCARTQGADVVLDAWENMTHDFQIFGPDAPQSAEALLRLGQVIDARVRGRKRTGTA